MPIAIGTRRRRNRRLLAVVMVLAALSVFGFLRFWAALEARRTLRAHGPSWQFPSRIYSDGVSFTPGRILTPATLRAHLAARGYEEAPAPLRRPGTYAWSGARVEVFTRGFADVPRAEEQLSSERVRITLANGRLVRVEPLAGGDARQRGRRHLTEPGLEPVRIGHVFGPDHVRRTWVPLGRVPPIVRQAIVASEDRRFYQHLGLDLRSNLRALVANLRAGGVREGGSTITQQVARGLFLGQERTVPRKLIEMSIALGMEILLSKNDILEMYVNSIYWGRTGASGVAGIEEASRYYFGLPVDSLGVTEAALLAGIIPAPNASSPFRSPARAKARRNAAVKDMVSTGVIDAETGIRVLLSPLPRRPGPSEPEQYPAYAGHVYETLAPIDRDALMYHGVTVMTHLDLVAQQTAERELTAGVEELERYLGRGPAPLQGAFVMIDPATGAVRAMVGGRSSRPGDFNRASQARRQCGSAIKPIVYAAALDETRRGPRFTPATIVPDLPREFPTPEGPWKPRNDDGQYHATVTLAKALTHSINVATANIVDSLGPATVARYGDRFGLKDLKPVASIGLGSNEVTLRDLVSAFAVFPARGVRREPTPVRAVYDIDGRALMRADLAAIPVIPARTAALMTNLLEDVVIFGIAYPLRHSYGYMFPLGGKTGTTNDYKDGWFVGFTPEMVAGVWVGYDQPQSLRGPAVNTALPLWARIMGPLFAGRPAAPFDSDRELTEVWIDPWSGGLATPNCPSKLRVGMLPRTIPRFACTRDHEADWQRVFERRFADSLSTVARESARRESLYDPIPR